MLSVDDLAGFIGEADFPSGIRVWAGVAEGSSVTWSGGDGRGLTPMYCASLAKQVVAACVAVLVQDGVVHANAAVSDTLSGLPPWADAVTVHHLAAHTSGLPLGGDGFDPHGLESWTSERAWRELCSTAVVQAPAGEQFAYSGLGYVCLARLVGSASGIPIETFAEQRLFKPLGMAQTCMWSGAAEHPPGAHPFPSGVARALSVGDGGLWSTVPDLLRWGDAMCRDELGVRDLLTQPGVLNDGTHLDYCWGVRRIQLPSGETFSHGGSWPGTTSKLLWQPTTGRSVALISNSEDAQRITSLTLRLLAG
jgi:CubicO group peptidase (beta-lactamase class C family)